MLAGACTRGNPTSAGNRGGAGGRSKLGPVHNASTSSAAPRSSFQARAQRIRRLPTDT